MANEIYIRHPSEQRFYRIMAFIMGLLGFNTHYWSWFANPPSKLYALQRKVVIIFLPVVLASMLIYLSLHYRDHDFSVLASILSVIPFTMSLTCKVMSAQTSSYKTAHSEFMDKIHLYNVYTQTANRQKHNFVKRILLETEKKTRFTLYCMMTVTLTCCNAWTFVPMMHNIQNNYSVHNITTRLELGVYLWQPFDFEYSFYGYLVSQVLVTYCSFIGALVWVLFDTMTVTFVLHLVGHLHIFKYDLQAVSNETLTNDEWDKKLKEATATYSFITKTFKNIENAYGLNVASIYAQNLLQGGLLLYQFTTSGTDMGVILTYGLMIPIFMGTLVVLSVVLENVRILADDIPDLVYALPWEDMSISNRKLLRCIILQVQPRLEYKAVFNIKAGVKPAIGILKTTFSYYVMIKSKKEK